VSVLVFSLGVLALVNLQAASVRLATDARFRADAAFLADQLFARMLISAPADAPSFAHRTAVGANCAPGGANTAHAPAEEWLEEVRQTLPGAEPEAQQVIVDNGLVTVRLCWAQGEDAPRQFVVTNRIQWQP